MDADRRQPLAFTVLGGNPANLASRTLAPGERSEPFEIEARQATCRSGHGSVLPAGTYDLVVMAEGAEGRARISIAD